VCLRATQLAADRVRWTVEDQLGRVFDRLEHEAAASEERRLEGERKRAEARLAWEDAMESARLRLVEHHRVTWLDRQLADAARVRSARSFVRAARQGIALAD
jgi:hypothetical protein